VSNSLKIVSSGLLETNVGVNGCVSSSSNKILAISKWNMFTIRTLVALGKPKIDDVNRVFGVLVATNQEIVWFNISIDDSFLVHNLDHLNHLDCNMQHRLQIELATALLEKICKRLSEHVHDHNAVHLAIFSLLVSNELEIWNSGFSFEFMNEFSLPKEHTVLLILHSLLNLCGKEVSSFLFSTL